MIDVVSGAGERLDELMLPKVQSAAEVVALDLLLTQVEKKCGLPAGHVGIEAQIETTRGLINVEEICAASPRLETIIFGPADFAASMEMPVLTGGVAIPEYPLSLIHIFELPVRHRVRRRLGILRAWLRRHQLRVRPRGVRLVSHRVPPVPLRPVQPGHRLHRPDRVPGGGMRAPLGGRSDLHHHQRRGRRHRRAERAVLDSGTTVAASSCLRLGPDQLPGRRHGLERGWCRLRSDDRIREAVCLRGLRRPGRPVGHLAGQADRGHHRVPTRRLLPGGL